MLKNTTKASKTQLNIFIIYKKIALDFLLHKFMNYFKGVATISKLKKSK